ncbi:MAG: hypothetical protein Q7J26_01850 [Brevundimonas sp.]|uniref:hypothetical protein n=1 Tax=Brevundimonas sp. TaxID=1871086 RepID=UPI00271E00FB|nr:hypothetical protein [Brevundimonas sp.]MDO9607241.1 hypothetical protein [Brevundimonas sp.]
MAAGFQLNNDRGELVLELGGHVLATQPLMLAKVGEIASEWAHAEAELERCLAALMDTSPERTFALLQPYRSAAATATGARALAGATLKGADLDGFNVLIDRFKNIAEERNKVQHGIWVKITSQPGKLGRVKAVDYSRFQVDILHSKNQVATAEAFAAGVTDLYDVNRLAAIVTKIQTLTVDIIQASMGYLLKSETLAKLIK